MSRSRTTIRIVAQPPRPRRLLRLVAAALLLAPQLALAQGASVSLGRAEIRKLVEGGSKRDGELRSFYEGRAWQPLWVRGGELGPAADALLELVQNADADGVSRTALRVDDLASTLQIARSDPDRKSLAQAEIALSRTFSAYVQATRIARGSGMTYQNSLLAPVVPTPGSALKAAAAAPSLARYIEKLEWMHPLYAEMRTALIGSDLKPEQERLVWINLERVRGLPADPAPRYVLIDAAGARLWMYENGRPVDSMKVVVGKPDQPTPMIAGTLTNAVLNPYWNVPVDLVRTKVAASVLREGLGYLHRGGYEVLSDFTDKATLLDPQTIDWRAVADGSRELRVRQLPGKPNFMGTVKFNFPNSEGIYLHDTPEKELLKADVRTASAGCVRLEDADRLGRWLFRAPLVPQSTAPEQVVLLDQPVPVYITYLTAAPVEGRIVFRNDVYKRDAAQWALLAG